jgi:hypothetical protein
MNRGHRNEARWPNGMNRIGNKGRCLPVMHALAEEIDLTWSAMLVNIVTKNHIVEVRYENYPDDPR